MKCEYCKHWDGASFSHRISSGASVIGMPDTGTWRHFQANPKALTGKCLRFPVETHVLSNHFCGEFSIGHDVLDVLSTDLVVQRNNFVNACERNAVLKKSLDGSRETNRKLRAKLLALQLKEKP